MRYAKQGARTKLQRREYLRQALRFLESYFLYSTVSKFEQHFEHKEHYHQIIGVLAAIPQQLIYSNRPLRHEDWKFSVFIGNLIFS